MTECMITTDDLYKSPFDDPFTQMNNDMLRPRILYWIVKIISHKQIIPGSQKNMIQIRRDTLTEAEKMVAKNIPQPLDNLFGFALREDVKRMYEILLIVHHVFCERYPEYKEIDISPEAIIAMDEPDDFPEASKKSVDVSEQSEGLLISVYEK